MLRYILTVCIFSAILATIAGKDIGRLHLTPFIKTGDVRQARDLSLVTGLTPNITSYSGFLTIDEECGSNLFFWFFPSQNDWLQDPVTVWLNGGPGQSSLFGLFIEHGPYELNAEGGLSLREYSWNRNTSVIYIDNPVGTGFSYTSTLDCYLTNESQIALALLEGLQQFFVVFPEINENQFYVAGESYGGKYATSLARTIYDTNSSINLQGLIIGNGLIDPLNQMEFSNFFYQTGLVDEKVFNSIDMQQDGVRSSILREDYLEANERLGALMAEFFSGSGYTSLFNYLEESSSPTADYKSFVNQTEVREAIHVGDSPWQDGNDANIQLMADKMWSAKRWLEELLENKYRVLIYTGQMDLVTTYPSVVNYIEKLQWSEHLVFMSSDRSMWYVNSALGGYYRSGGGLTEVMVRNVGHYVPIENPQYAFFIYNTFIQGLIL